MASRRFNLLEGFGLTGRSGEAVTIGAQVLLA
jgi:hypothetical protein